ncbi:MAG TPA: glycine zipper 2TM domain-containing protein [Hydrogenophaga sp.]|nr:glycine zipper 2TM domain-containing protein [Hydrogenophaga sp.]
MKTSTPRNFKALLPSALTAVAVLALAGCAAPYPYPVHEQPVAQPPQQVYTYPAPPQAQPQESRRDYRRRDRERLFDTPVTSVRAVMGERGQRCWIEREEVSQPRGPANVPGAIAGAVIGGILGHQIGGGSGRDIATAGGAVAGAVVGANVGRSGAYGATHTQDVQRCTSDSTRDTPDYWDVTYTFRGIEHRVQMTEPPGRMITVNRDGEPRI